MSIQTELQRIKTNVSNTLNAIQAHGGVVPLDANSNDMATCVKTIPTGTGVEIELPTDDEILQALIDTDFLLAVTDADGAILADSDGAILVM